MPRGLRGWEREMEKGRGKVEKVKGKVWKVKQEVEKAEEKVEKARKSLELLGHDERGDLSKAETMS